MSDHAYAEVPAASLRDASRSGRIWTKPMHVSSSTRIMGKRALLTASALFGAGLAACGDGAGEGLMGLDPAPPVMFTAQARPAYASLRERWRGGTASEGSAGGTFTVGRDHILRDGEPFEVRGVVYVPGYPGHMPWDVEVAPALPEKLRNSIDRDMAFVAGMGANTVRFWGAPRYAYEALARTGSLNFVQTLWVGTEVADLHDPAFKAQTRAYFRSVIDRINQVFPNGSAPLIAYLIGNEISASTIRATDAAHPELDRFTGTHVRTDAGLSASEVFLAEMADYVKGYEEATWGVSHLVSYSNMIYTADLIDTPFLDFRSFNVYPYDIPWLRPNTAPGSRTGTYLQGWVEELRARHPEVPLLVTETGLSVSPNAPHRGPPDYGYGGNTEFEQASGILQALEDVATAKDPLAGVVVHELLDAWWKFDLQDSYTQDPDDVEEWFGLMKLTGS